MSRYASVFGMGRLMSYFILYLGIEYRYAVLDLFVGRRGPILYIKMSTGKVLSNRVEGWRGPFIRQRWPV